LHTPDDGAAGTRRRGGREPAGRVMPGGVTDLAIRAGSTDPEEQVVYLGSRGVIVNSLNEKGRRIVLKPSSLMRQATVAKSATMGFWTFPHRPSTTGNMDGEREREGESV
jgi:hypothetical protein